MSLFKFKIRTKLSAVFFVTVLLVIGSTTLLWFTTVRTMLAKQVNDQQNQIGKRASEKVEEFIRAKERALIIHSQSAAFLTDDSNSEKIDLVTFLSQDQDILELTAIGKDGTEKVKIKRQGGIDTNLTDRSHSPSFIANTFRYSKEYLGDVVFSEDGDPMILISVPIKPPVVLQSLTNLSTEIPFAFANESILGVLEAQVSLKSIFAEITDFGIDEGNSVFIVDDKGRVIANRNTDQFARDVTISSLPPVAKHLKTITNDPILHEEQFEVFEYTSPNGSVVLGSHSHVHDTSWAIVIEQPVKTAYQNLNRILSFAIILLLGSVFVTIPISYWIAKRITNPVLALISGANRVSQGHLESRITVDTDDELEDMASAFNNMTQKLQSSIEELKHDKDVIATERNKLEVVLSGIEDAVIALDEQKRVVLLNAAAEKLLGFVNTETVGKKVGQLFKLFIEDKEIPERIYFSSSSRRYTLFDQNDVLLHASNGIKKTVHFISGRIQSDVSEVRYILTMQDVTAKQKLEEMKVDFVSMAAHELRTPLTSVRGYLATFLNDYKNTLNDDQKNLLENANTAANRLTELVESLLELTRMEKTGINVKKQSIDWVPFVSKYVHDFNKSAKERSITLEFVKPENPIPQMECDDLRIGEVLSNLLSNALKYTNEGGFVTVTTQYDTLTKMVTTSVKDTGIGIPKDALENLFTKFYRVPGKLEQTARGTGLGLYISKKIIDLHNGRIWVQSEEGKGSVFAFSLPA